MQAKQFDRSLAEFREPKPSSLERKPSAELELPRIVGGGLLACVGVEQVYIKRVVLVD